MADMTAPERRTGWRAWALAQGNSPRLAFIVRTFVMVAGAAMALLWSRLLVHTLGKEVYGLFLAFLAVTQLGGLGDLGMSGGMGVRVLGYLAKGDDAACQRFLATARVLFGALAVFFAMIGLALAPQLPHWLGFVALPEAGSLTWLFALGGLSVGVLIISGYYQSLNYVQGNVVWPILPGFVLSQAAMFLQWELALHRAPFWQQYLPHLAAMVLGAWMTWLLLKFSHPWLGNLRPVRWEFGEAWSLATSSIWVTFSTLGSLVYVTTDRIVINAFFGPEPVPAYRFNNRLCELAMALLGTASFVALPAIIKRLLSDRAEERTQGLEGFHRLQVMQAVAGCGIAQGYLLVNDGFIKLWLGADFQVPLSWQAGFAAVVANAIAGDAGLQILARLTPQEVRVSGLVVFLTAALNFILSVAAAKMGSVLGIVAATFVAQSASSVLLNSRTCRRLQLPYSRAFARTWLAPLAVSGIAAAIRWWVPLSSVSGIATAVFLNVVLFAAVAWVVGLRRDVIEFELGKFRSLFGKA